MPPSKLKSDSEVRPLEAETPSPSKLKSDPEVQPSRAGTVPPVGIITKFFEKYNPMRNESFQKAAESTLIKSAAVESPKLFDPKETYKPERTDNIAVDMDNIKINETKWNDLKDEYKEAFWEGFDTGELAKKGEKQAKPKENNWTSKFNIGNPNTDDGHWVTLDNGKHLFIKDG